MALQLEETKYPRGFEVVNSPKVAGATTLPTRADIGSAGYDFYSKQTKQILPKQVVKFTTDVKAFMQEDEVLYVHVRSSIGIKKGLTLANGTGVIDSTYYGNPDNDGNIIIALVNNSDDVVTINAAERIAQGVFHKYLTVGDRPEGVRVGGIGSSGK